MRASVIDRLSVRLAFGGYSLLECHPRSESTEDAELSDLRMSDSRFELDPELLMPWAREPARIRRDSRRSNRRDRVEVQLLT
jgi:hypothetical protein